MLMLITSGVVYAKDKTNEVKFADSTVESAVREAIGKSSGTIHKNDIENIKTLSITVKGDTLDLTGLGAITRVVLADTC